MKAPLNCLKQSVDFNESPGAFQALALRAAVR